ncbi:MAG: outer membrane beta-barrel protein [Alphaproteobacteria bacterium]|nr:outer membrane beta-barrel protein [Alphaproteobacteria bacterium]
MIPGTDLFYLTADVGREMLTFGEGRGSLALFMGYNYWTEENEGWGLYNRLTGAQGTSTDVQVFNNKVEWHSFRLGALAEFPLNDRLSLTADVAFVPYADMHNEDSHILRTAMADLGPVPNIIMDGSGLGFQGEVGLAYDLTQNLEAALGFRYWNLQGDGDVTLGVDSTTPGGPFSLNDFDTFRYGISAGLTYGF